MGDRNRSRTVPPMTAMLKCSLWHCVTSQWAASHPNRQRQPCECLQVTLRFYLRTASRNNLPALQVNTKSQALHTAYTVCSAEVRIAHLPLQTEPCARCCNVRSDLLACVNIIPLFSIGLHVAV